MCGCQKRAGPGWAASSCFCLPVPRAATAKVLFSSHLHESLVQVLQEIQERAHGITGVPNFTINGQYVLSGAQVGCGCPLLASRPLLLFVILSGS